MKKIYTLLFICFLFILSGKISLAQNIAIAVHGGAGNIIPERFTEETIKEYKQKLEEALKAGYKILGNGGSSLDAVEAAVRIMEDSPLFNAGKGAVFTADGKNELDASIMDGKTLKAGAVAGVRRIKNPITAARAVMEKSPHVMMVGSGAETFATENKLELVDTSYFIVKPAPSKAQPKGIEKGFVPADVISQEKYGTVGAVALDKNGNLASATSTGGMSNKRYGRVGDSPIIGAGTYADNNACAVSCTGHGEYFIRAVIAYDVIALMKYGSFSLNEAVLEVLKKLTLMGGEGGIIAIDKNGNISEEFNSNGMFRGHIDKEGNVFVKIFKN
jgi:L-asparaginase / beta-aspartyl-peptidase